MAMNEEEIRRDVASLIDLYEKSEARGTGVEERARANEEAKKIVVRLGTELVVGFFRLIDAIEKGAR